MKKIFFVLYLSIGIKGLLFGQYLVESKVIKVNSKLFYTRIKIENGGQYKFEVSKSTIFPDSSSSNFIISTETHIVEFTKLFGIKINELDSSIDYNNEEVLHEGNSYYFKFKALTLSIDDAPEAAIIEITSKDIPIYNITDNIIELCLKDTITNKTVVVKYTENGKKGIYSNNELLAFQQLLPADSAYIFTSESKKLLDDLLLKYGNFYSKKTNTSIGSMELKYITTLQKNKLLLPIERSTYLSIPNNDLQYVNLEFKEGYIENIDVEILINERRYIFSNYKPIGSSTLFNLNNLKTYYLYESSEKFCIKLSDIIENYQRILKEGRRDYSPQNQVLTLSPKSKTTILKNKTKELFIGKVYTDIVGFDPKNPNGLVQTEISKKINLNTYRYSNTFCRKWLNYGFFQFLEPYFLLSKLEDHNRHLQLFQRNDIINGSLFTSFYANTLEVYRYQTFSAGFNMNILMIDVPPMKSSFYIDFGARYLLTVLRDSTVRLNNNSVIEKTGTVQDFYASSVFIYPELRWLLEPDERYGLDLSFKFGYLWLWNDNVTQVNKMSLFTNTGIDNDNNWLFTSTFNAYVKPTKNLNSQIFARVVFNTAIDNLSNNFFQAQLGYSFYLIGKSSD